MTPYHRPAATAIAPSNTAMIWLRFSFDSLVMLSILFRELTFEGEEDKRLPQFAAVGLPRGSQRHLYLLQVCPEIRVVDNGLLELGYLITGGVIVGFKCQNN